MFILGSGGSERMYMICASTNTSTSIHCIEPREYYYSVIINDIFYNVCRYEQMKGNIDALKADIQVSE